MLVLVVIGVVFAAAVAIAIRSSEDAPPPVQDETVATVPRTLVALHDLQAGAVVMPGVDIDWTAMKEDQIQDSFLREGGIVLADYQGAVLRRAVKAGEALKNGDIVRRGVGGLLPAVLTPGMRAVSIAVSATSGNAGFIAPGDRVDLLLTHRIRVKDGPGAEVSDSLVSETFMENIRVLAVDQMMNNPDNQAVLAKTITVEVTPQQAEQINVASEMGKISLTLRSLAGTAADAPKPKEENKESANAAAEGKDKTASAKPKEAPLVDPFTMETVDGAAPDVGAGETGAGNARVQRMTTDRQVSHILQPSSPSNPKIRVIRGDQVEQVEFLREGK